MKKTIIKNISIISAIIFILFSLTSCFNLFCKHEYVETKKVVATCSTEGYILKECTLCQKEVKEIISKLPHNYEEEVVNPTCTEQGYTINTCENCGHVLKDDFKEALGHNFSVWEIIKEPTEVANGLKERKCQSCSFVEQEVILSVSYINLDIIKQPFDENINYKCSSYEELLLMFNCALLRNATKLSSTLNFTYNSLQTLLENLCDDEEIPNAFHVQASLSNNVLELTFEYTADPNLISSKTYYTQYSSLNYVENSNLRPINFNDFAIESSINTYSVTTSDQLYYALERGFKPLCKEGTDAYKVYEEMKKVLRNIISDDMTDIQKVIAIHDYLVMNVTYDEEVLQLLYQGNKDTYQYRSFYLEGVFFDKKAVCEGISKAFTSLCNIEGIPCVVVEGYQKNNPNGAGHAWNKVYVDNNWYIVDVTSDGTIIEGAYEILSYKYCLIDEATINNLYIAKNYEHIICNKKINVYKEMTFTYNDQTYDFNIESMKELETLVKYFESIKRTNLTIEFNIAFDCGTSCKDEVTKAYQNNGFSTSYTFIDSTPIFMLIKK